MGELGGALGEAVGAAEVQEGVDPVCVLADRGDDHRQPDGTGEPSLQRWVVVLGAVTWVKKPNCNHAVSLADRHPSM